MPAARVSRTCLTIASHLSNRSMRSPLGSSRWARFSLGTLAPGGWRRGVLPGEGRRARVAPSQGTDGKEADGGTVGAVAGVKLEDSPSRAPKGTDATETRQSSPPVPAGAAPGCFTPIQRLEPRRFPPSWLRKGLHDTLTRPHSCNRVELALHDDWLTKRT